MKLNQLHAVSRTQQGRQRELSVKTLRPPLSAKFWSNCVLSGGTQRLAFASTPEQTNENISVNKYVISSDEDRTHNQSVYTHTFCPCATTGFLYLSDIFLLCLRESVQ